MRSKLRRSLEWLSFVACLAFSVYSCERIALCCLSKQPSQRGASSRKWRPHTSLPPFVSRWVKKLQETFSGCHFRCNNSKMIALKLSLTCWRKTGRPPYWGGKSPIHIRVLKAQQKNPKIALFTPILIIFLTGPLNLIFPENTGYVDYCCEEPNDSEDFLVSSTSRCWKCTSGLPAVDFQGH